MRYGEEKSPQSSISRSLEASVTSFETEKIRGKFGPKSDEGILLGYPTNSRAYRVFNKRTWTVMESINVVIDDEEVGSPSKGEKTLSFQEELPTPSTDMVKPSSSTKETPVIPSAAPPASTRSSKNCVFWGYCQCIWRWGCTY